MEKLSFTFTIMKQKVFKIYSNTKYKKNQPKPKL